MSYSTGMLCHRITVLNKKDPSKLKFGETNKFEEVMCLWADVTWKKGQKALNEGALDSMDTVLIRTRWSSQISRDSLIEYEGVRYQIQSMHKDRRSNTTQITATEMVGPAPKVEPQPVSNSDI